MSLFGASTPSFGASVPSLGLSAPGSSQPSLFGQSQSPFGAPGQSQQSLFAGQPTQSQGSLFGASNAPSQSSLFGAPSTSAPSQPVFDGSGQFQSNLFGSSSGAFGQTSLLSGLGQSSQSSLFPSMSAGPLSQSPGSGLFQTTGFGAFPAQSQTFGSTGQQQQQIMGQQSQFQQYNRAPDQQALMQMHLFGVALPSKLNEIANLLNPRNPDSPFRATLYNVVSPGDIARYQRPPEMSEKAFDAAMLNNPDPSKLVPVMAMGFDSLCRRTEIQEGRAKEHAKALSAIESIIVEIEDSVSTELDTKLAIYRRSNRELARKLLNLACRVERKACANDTDPSLKQAEIEQKRRLEAIARNLAAPAMFKDKLNDLIELADATRSERSRFMGAMPRPQNAAATQAIRELLQEQLIGISHLGEVCRRADRDISILEGEAAP